MQEEIGDEFVEPHEDPTIFQPGPGELETVSEHAPETQAHAASDARSGSIEPPSYTVEDPPPHAVEDDGSPGPGGLVGSGDLAEERGVGEQHDFVDEASTKSFLDPAVEAARRALTGQGHTAPSAVAPAAPSPVAPRPARDMIGRSTERRERFPVRVAAVPPATVGPPPLGGDEVEGRRGPRPAGSRTRARLRRRWIEYSALAVLVVVCGLLITAVVLKMRAEERDATADAARYVAPTVEVSAPGAAPEQRRTVTSTPTPAATRSAAGTR